MEQQIIVDCIDTAEFVCPECSRKKIMQLSGYDIKKQRTRVRCVCKCGHVYTAVLVKETDLTFPGTQLFGMFTTKAHENICSGRMVIKTLNSRGIIFKTFIEQNFWPGLRLLLEFVLDDAKQSIVQADVIVRAKKGKYMSAVFLSQKHCLNLGSYLFFNKLYV